MPTLAQQGVINEISRRTDRGEKFGSIVAKHGLGLSYPFTQTAEAYKQRFSKEVGDISGQQARLQKGLSSAVALKFGGVGGTSVRNLVGGNVEQMVRKAKARSEIAGRGDEAIRNQQLKERVGLAKSAIARRNLNIQASMAAAQQQSGLQASLQAAKDQVSAARAGMFGSLAGGLTAGLIDRFKTGTTSVDQGLDQGTAAADYMNMQEYDLRTPSLDIGEASSTFGDPFIPSGPSTVLG